MGRSKMNYIYDSYDSFIEQLEQCESIDEVQNVIETIRQERDDLPSTKEVCNEFADNYNDQDGVKEFKKFLKNNPEIDLGADENE